jgi:hypothetical protein
MRRIVGWIAWFLVERVILFVARRVFCPRVAA